MVYSSSKTALDALTVHYAREFAASKLKINGAAPGHVATASTTSAELEPRTRALPSRSVSQPSAPTAPPERHEDNIKLA